jgi:hypothetical protein
MLGFFAMRQDDVLKEKQKKSKGKSLAEMKGVASQVIAQKRGANPGHPTFLLLPCRLDL